MNGTTWTIEGLQAFADWIYQAIGPRARRLVSVTCSHAVRRLILASTPPPHDLDFIVIADRDAGERVTFRYANGLAFTRSTPCNFSARDKEPT